MLLTVDNLTKRYGERTVVDGVSVCLAPGVNALLGANGAGKTTLMRMLCGLIRATEGRILLDGAPVDTMSGAYTRLLGYLPQDFPIEPEFSARDFLLYMAALKGIQPEKAGTRADALLREVGLEGESMRKVKTFSGGMKRRLGIAQAMIGSPRILVLDEPTAGLDPRERVRFRELVMRCGQKSVVLISTHIVSDVEAIASRVVMMEKGRIMACGTIRELKEAYAGGNDDLETVYMNCCEGGGRR